MTGFDGISFDEAELLVPQPQLPDPEQLGRPLDVLDVLRLNRERERRQRLRRSVVVALQSNPEFVAEAKKLGLETGADPVQIEKDLEGYRALSQALQIRRWLETAEAAQDSTSLRWKLQDPEFAKLAYQELDALGTLERAGDAFERGGQQVELGRLESRARDVGLTAAEESRRLELHRIMEEDPIPGGFVRGSLEIVGQLAEMLPQAVESGIGVGLGFAGTAAVAGQLGPQAATPEEGLTVPGAFIGGFITGAGGAFAVDAYRVEGGFLYRDMLDSGIDPVTSAWTSRIGGSVAAALESVGAGIAGRGVGLLSRPIRRQFFDQAGREAARALTRPTMTRAAADLARGALTIYGGEVATEALQKGNEFLFEGIGRAIQGLPPEPLGDQINEFGAEMAKVAQAMVLLSLPGPSVTFVHDVRRVRQAERDGEAFLNLADAVEETKLKDRSPDETEDLIDRTLADKRGRTIHIQAERFVEALSQTGQSRDQLRQEHPDLDAQLDDALATGGDVVTPTARYEARIIGSKLDGALRQHIRFDPDDPSVAEIPEVQVAAKELQRQAVEGLEKAVTFAERARVLEETFRKQVEAVRAKNITPQQARATAAAFRATISTLASRFPDLMPDEFLSQMGGLGVVQGTLGTEAALRQTTDSDAFREFFGNSKVVDDEGRPLVVFKGVYEPLDVIDSPSDFPAFNRGEEGVQIAGFFGDAETATRFMEPFTRTGVVQPVFLSFQNPKVIDAAGEKAGNIQFGESGREFRDAIRSGEFDSVIIENTSDEGTIYVALKPEQVKSVYNRGTFDPADPNILRQEEGEIKGVFGLDETGKGIIGLADNADVTTVLHELVHAYAHWLAQIAAQVNTDAFQTADIQTRGAMLFAASEFNRFLDWRGIEGGIDAWNAMSFEEQRPHAEALAEEGERYFFTGKAPVPELKSLFADIRRWIVHLWRNIRGKDQQVDPAISDFFDRMLASEDAVAYAESARGLEPLLDEKPPEMDDAAWQRYQRLLDEATEEAVAQVTKRSINTMQWLRNATRGKLREMQKAHDAARAEIEADVRQDVMNEPAYRADRFVRTGVFRDPDGSETGFSLNHKLRTESVRDVFPLADLRSLGVPTHPEGILPDEAAGMFDMATGEELVRTLADLRPMQEVIDEQVDARMVKEHSDLVDARAIQQAVDEALHNQVRARMLAAELNAMGGATRPLRVWTAAARELAEDILARTPVSQIKVWRYQAAERRANKAAVTAARKTDTVAALEAKRSELLQHELARLANKVERNVKRVEIRFAKFFRTNESLGKNHNVDIVEIGRAILAAHKFKDKSGTTAQEHLDTIAGYAPELAEELSVVVSRVMENDMHYKNLPYGEFLMLTDAIDAVWYRSLRERQIFIDGERKSIDQFADRLFDVLNPPEGPPPKAISSKSPRNVFGSLKAWVRHVESWTLQMDGNTTGDVHRLLFALLREPFDDYMAEKEVRVVELDKRLRALKVKKKQNIAAPEFGANVIFEDKRAVLGVLLHSGNASNIRGLLLGRGWIEQPAKRGDKINEAPLWKFLRRMHEEGVLTEQDFEFAQYVWNQFDELFPRSQQTHLEMYGYRAEAIDARQFRIGGKLYKGGYYPRTVDHAAAKERTAKLRLEATRRGEEASTVIAPPLETKDDVINTSRDFRSAMPSTGRDFMHTRKEVHHPVVLDVRLATRALDEQLRFIHLQRPGRDTLRLLNHPKVAAAIDTVDPSAREKMFIPYLHDTLQNRVMKSSGMPELDATLMWIRRNVGVSVMFGNLTVGVQQMTGLGSTIAFTGLRPVRDAMWAYTRDRQGVTERVLAASTFARNRIEHQAGQITDDADLLINFEWLEKAQRLTKKHGFFIQRLFQIPVDIITWTAAHNQAIEQGRTEEEAVRHADAILRRAQGSGLAPDISALERSFSFIRLTTQFQSFWFAMQNALQQHPSPKRFALIFGLVGLGGAAMSQLMRGGWEDEEEDGSMWDDIASWTFSETLQTGTAMLPSLLSQLPRPLTGEFGGRIELGAAASQVTRGISSIALPFELLGVIGSREGITDVRGSDVREVATALTLLTGLPMSFFARPLGFQLDVSNRQVEQPSGVVDHVRGLFVGR